jgi:hypothetical protein
MEWIAMIWQWVLSCLNGLLGSKPVRVFWTAAPQIAELGAIAVEKMDRSRAGRTKGPTFDLNPGAIVWNWHATVIVWLIPRLCLVAVPAARRARGGQTLSPFAPRKAVDRGAIDDIRRW